MTRRLISALLAIAAIAIFAQSAGAAPTAIDGGSYANCYVDSGAVYCWSGASATWLYDYPAGAPTTSAPTKVAGLTGGVTDISISSRHACAVVSGGARCWGDNDDYQLGDPEYGNSTVPIPVVGLGSGVTDVDAGDDYSCAVASGAVKCWGASNGLDFPFSSDDYSYTPQTIPGLTSGATAVATGYNLACAIVSGGVKCWGIGRLGDGTEHGGDALVSVPGLTSNVTDIAISNKTICAVQSGAVKCWGESGYGLVPGGSSYMDSPVAATGLESGVTDISLGFYTGCGVVAGAVKCWGWGLYGLLANGDSGVANTPVQIPGLTSGAVAVSTSPYANCAIVGVVAGCWGNNEGGMLGDGVLINALTPKSVPALASGVTDISAGYRGGCAVVSGAGKCWGNLKQPSSSSAADGLESASPATVQGLEAGVTDIDVDTYGCATVSSAVKCWTRPVLGNPPVAVATTGAESGATGIDTTDYRQCAVVSGAAKCATPSYTETREFTAVPGLGSGISQVAQSVTHRCAIASGAAKCWGSNDFGGLGTGDFENSETPQQVVGLTSGVTSISAGAWFTCAVVGGAAKCWGRGDYAELGDGEMTDSPVPVQVEGLTSGVTSISASDDNACAVKDGDVYCWGVGDQGEIGDNNRYGSTIPVKALDLPSTVSQVSAGSSHNCAVAAGAAYCWGANTYGQLGMGTTFGNSGPAVTVTPDGAPSVGFVKPIPDSYVLTSDVPVSIATANTTSVSCKLDGGDWTSCPSVYNGLSEGDHWLRVAGENDVGQIAIADSLFYIDAYPAKATIISPADGSTAQTNTPALYFEIDDDYEYVTCTLDGAPLLDEYGDQEFCDYIEKLPALSVGTHTLVVTVHDYLGRAASTTSVFRYGTVATPPAPTKLAPSSRAGLSGKAKRSGNSLKVKYAFSFVPPNGFARLDPKAVCSGTVNVTAKYGKKKKTSKKAKLKYSLGKCRANATFRLPRSTSGKRVTFDAFFPGNSVMQPAHEVSKLKIKR